MDYYNAMLADHQNQSVRQEILGSGKTQTVSGSGEASIACVSLRDTSGQEVEIVRVGQTVRLFISAYCCTDIPELVVGYMIKDRLGQPVFGTNTYHLGHRIFNQPSGKTIEFEFEFDNNIGPRKIGRAHV